MSILDCLKSATTVSRRAFFFENIRNASFTKPKMGGVIHSTQQLESFQTIDNNACGLDDGIDGCPSCVSFEFVNHGDPCYVLVLKAERQLRNGFRYIKELLLQNHNFKLMQAYDLLTAASISITSVKTDCFTIPAKREQNAR
jgi:hypothetical protein